MDQSGLFRSARRENIEQAEAKTTKNPRKRTEQALVEPMQCKPVTALPVNEKWTFEIKFDGYRCIALKRGSEVTLFSRNEKKCLKRFPKVVHALASLGGDFVLDGELVAFDPQGRPSFQLLQNNQSRALPVYFYAFDLLNYDGEALLNLSIERRRELLARLLRAPRRSAALVAAVAGVIGQVLEAVRKLGLEGVVAKRIDSTYEPGERSGAWVIGGYIPGAHGFDALLVGVYENKQLIFAAKVKNGFVPRLRDEIFPTQGFIALLVVECSGAEHWSVPGDEVQHQVQRAVNGTCYNAERSTGHRTL